MKQGFTSLLLFVLLIMTPSISFASEIDRPLNSLRLTDTISDLVGGLAGLNLSVQEENPPQNPSESSSNSPEAVKTSTTANKTSRASEEIGSMESVSNGVESADGQIQSAEVKSSQLLGIKLNLPIVGKVSLGLNTSEKSDSSSNETATSGGLLDLEIVDSKVLGDVKVEVLTHETQTDKSKAVNLVNIDAKTPIVDLQVGIGNNGVEVENTPIAVPEESVVEEVISNSAESYKPDDQQIKQPNEQTIKKPFQPAKQVKPEKQGGNSKAEFVEPIVETHDNDHEPETSDSEQPSVVGNDMAVGNFARTDFYGEIGAEDSIPTAQDLEMAEKMENLKIIIQKLSGNDKLQMVSPSSSVTTSGSGSGSTGASNVSSSFGIAAYLSSESLSEIELCCEVSNRLIELSDQWSKSPPIDPPKASFFLYA